MASEREAVPIEDPKRSVPEDVPTPTGTDATMDRRATYEFRSGRAMPVLGLGTWELTRDTAESVLDALEKGYRMIDTASDYGTHGGIGEALRGTDVPREEIFLVAKVEEHDEAYDATRRYLDELGQDQADLVLIHRPPENGVGIDLWKGLIRARDDGMTRDIGVSNYSIDQIQELIDVTGQPPVVNQIEWSPFGWSPEMLEYCADRDIAIQAYSPLTRANRLHDDTLEDIGARHDRTPAQVLLRWNLQLGTAPLPKASREEHRAENLGVFGWELDDEAMETLNALNESYSALGEKLQYV